MTMSCVEELCGGDFAMRKLLALFDPQIDKTQNEGSAVFAGRRLQLITYAHVCICTRVNPTL